MPTDFRKIDNQLNDCWCFQYPKLLSSCRCLSCISIRALASTHPPGLYAFVHNPEPHILSMLMWHLASDDTGILCDFYRETPRLQEGGHGRSEGSFCTVVLRGLRILSLIKIRLEGVLCRVAHGLKNRVDGNAFRPASI